ncbi:MAG: FAD-binding oxidoreductase [Gammaproteobacteria bacterium]|nr:FAD-binding oxidoreductase [Gammaproteobacteria bacterium]MDH3953831.1 FAD-binding oxidoreductase [Gammaproteobacteria bacterium]MDH4005538.1 FAD-binding oxidoreductase [Gammaproteobacteria bacterium]NCF59812.1 FAD-binding protein [Gammaproteobacteria bacterium]
MSKTDSFFAELADVVGDKACVTEEQALEPHVTEWRNVLHGRALAMVSPGTTAEVADIVRLCSRAGIAIVPQGGNTGLCGGAIPDESGQQLILSLARLNRIRSIDAQDFSMVAEAGCVLATLQDEARAVDRYFPLSLSAEGSCQIGGNLATNAGGINVIRYGTARQQVLGLEVVLADGSIIDGLRSLHKDTAGYDLKQLFIGSEGTLGIITAATLRLYPDPGETTTLLMTLPDAGSAVTLLAGMRAGLGDRIESFELISRYALQLVECHIGGAALPCELSGDWFVLAEVAVGEESAALGQFLEGAVEAGQLADAVIAKNLAEAETFWRARHAISEAQKYEGPSIKHDISVPVGRMREFLVRCAESLRGQEPSARPVIFGHVGDGNLHYNLSVPEDLASDAKRVGQVTTTIYDLVAELGGSFSAEHGVGVTKRTYLEQYRGGTELELMRRLKHALDPQALLNPGKVI